MTFTPPKPRPKLYRYATYLKHRSSNHFKVHPELKHALQAINAKDPWDYDRGIRGGTLFYLVEDEWKEVISVEKGGQKLTVDTVEEAFINGGIRIRSEEN